MVSAYARFLGLDSAEITEQFKREYHDFENRDARQKSSSVDLPGVASGRFDSYTSSISRSKNPDATQGVRSMWDKPIPSSDINQGYTSRSSTSPRRLPSASSRRSSYSDGSLPKNEYSGGAARQSLPARIFGSVFRSPIALVIVLVVILALLLVLWATVANSCKKQEDLIPATGGAVIHPSTSADGTTTTPGTDAGAVAAEDDSKYGTFELRVEPAAGTGPWTEVTVDGENVVARILEENVKFDVTDKCSILTAQPGNLKVYRNGEAVELTINDNNGSGSVDLTVLKKPEPDPVPDAGQETATNG
jgi:hypothetical protein